MHLTFKNLKSGVNVMYLSLSPLSEQVLCVFFDVVVCSTVVLQSLVLHALFLLSWFAGAISFAVRSARWLRLEKQYEADPDKTVINSIPFTRIASSVAASCVRISCLSVHVFLLGV